MRISDWSSDVCSSDLLQLTSERGHILRARYHHYPVTRLRSKPPPGSHASAYPEPVRQKQGRAEHPDARQQSVADEQLTQRDGGGTCEGPNNTGDKPRPLRERQPGQAEKSGRAQCCG